jgi:3-oxoadipate enol-lactonase
MRMEEDVSEELELYFETAGEGDTVLLLHGLGSSIRDWESQVPVLAKRHRVIAVDLRGHGRSSKPAGPYSVRGMAADIAGLIAELRLEHAHICGLSLGGMVAFQLATDYPHLVRSLAIINSGPAFPGRTLAGRLLVWYRLFVLRSKGLPALGSSIAARLYPRAEQDGLRRTFLERFSENDLEAYASTLKAIAKFDVDDKLTSIRCPVLVLASDGDYTPVSAKEAYVRRLPDAKLVVIRDSGHASPMDQPDAVNRALMEFWEACPPVMKTRNTL